MYSNPAIVMPTRSKLIANVTLAIGAQLIALWIAATVTPLVTCSGSHFHSSSAISQGYHPPNTIGSPSISVGSGTR